VFPHERIFSAVDFYNSGMLILRAPSGASDSLAHAIELINRDLDGITDHLDKLRQHEFWSNLHQFALAETKNAGPKAKLVAADHVNAAVRKALEMADEKISSHLREVDSASDRSRLWQMLHEAAEEQMRETKQPKAGHGGGGESA